MNNYALYLLTAIILWTFFLDATTSGVFCLVNEAHLLRKVPVPRAAVPLGVILRAGMDLAMNLVAVLAVALAVGVTPRLSWLEMPALVVFLAVVTAGVSFLCAAFYVRFRDTDQIWAVASQILFYGSPIIYTITVLPESAQAPVIILDTAPPRAATGGAAGQDRAPAGLPGVRGGGGGRGCTGPRPWRRVAHLSRRNCLSRCSSVCRPVSAHGGNNGNSAFAN